MLESSHPSTPVCYTPHTLLTHYTPPHITRPHTFHALTHYTPSHITCPHTLHALLTHYTPPQLSRQDSTISLERLLSVSTETKAEWLSETELALQKQLHSSSKKIDHLTELLRESEASSSRLSEQAKVLKEEIRRWVWSYSVT